MTETGAYTVSIIGIFISGFVVLVYDFYARLEIYRQLLIESGLADTLIKIINCLLSFHPIRNILSAESKQRLKNEKNLFDLHNNCFDGGFVCFYK